MKSTLFAALVLAAPLTAGCQCGGPDPAYDDPADNNPPTRTENDPPEIQEVSLPAFPPIGPKTVLKAHITDDRGLGSVAVDFRNHTEHNVYGTSYDLTFTGEDLGEGIGRAVIRANDNQGGHTDLGIEGIAVDLSPPDAQLLDDVVRRGEGSDVWIWVGDAFVLGKVTITFGEASQTYAFDEGYPPTFGEEWDQSLVNFPSLDLPEGSGAFSIQVWDATGNTITKDFDLLLDGTAPVVDIASPAPSTTVSGVFQVHATAADDSAGPVWISLSLGGTPIGTFIGPDADINVDTSDYAPGEVVLSAIALDEAGNESDPIEVPLVLE